MNKRKQIITDVLLNGNFSNVQESMSSNSEKLGMMNNCSSCIRGS